MHRSFKMEVWKSSSKGFIMLQPTEIYSGLQQHIRLHFEETQNTKVLVLSSGFTGLFKLEVAFSLLEDLYPLSTCPVQDPETKLLPYVDIGLKFFEFLNNETDIVFSKAGFKTFFPSGHLFS